MDKNITNFNTRLRTIRIRDLILGFIACIVLCTIVALLAPIFEVDDYFIILFFSIALLLFIWALRGTQGIKNNFEMLLEKDIQKEILYIFIINILFGYLFLFAFSAVDVLNGIIDPNWITMNDINTVNINSGMLILNAIVSIVLAPIVEELTFRGVLFNRLKIRAGIIPAMIISSIIFAVGHEVGGITSAFLFGMCMCILYLKTDNILVPMSIHFLNNVFATIMESTQLSSIVTQSALVFPSLLIAIIASILLIKYIIKESKILKKKYS